MRWVSLLTLACALAPDAFAVAIVTGLTLRPVTRQYGKVRTGDMGCSATTFDLAPAIASKL
jgi:putative Mn2+ efflux pump MntP